MDIELIAIQAGVIVVEEDSTYWSENNAIEVLSRFAQLVIQASDLAKIRNTHNE